MRRSFISLSWTQGVDPADAQNLLVTIGDIYEMLRGYLGVPGQYDPLPAVRVFGAWVLNGVPHNSAYSSIGWYLNRSLNDSGSAILASRFLDTVTLEPWQASQPHFDLMLTDITIHDDLEGRFPTDPVMGFTRRGLVSLISTAPLDKVRPLAMRTLALRQLYAHYLGQMFGVPVWSREDDMETYNGQVFCANDCAMRYLESPESATLFAAEQVEREVIYCQSCQKDLLGQITGYYYGLN